MSSASKRFANLSLEKKRALAAQLLREKARPPKVFPLSFAQRRLWFLDQLVPNSPLYNIPAVLHLDGALDLALLQRSLATVVRRHDSLRTTFRMIGERPVQVIAPTQPVALLLLDLQACPTAQRPDLTQQLALAEARQPFDLAHGPLIRARLLRLAASEHVLLLTLHHIIADGWSIGVLVRELTTLYAAYRSGVVPQLAALPVQYADFTLWQQTWLQGAVLEAQLAYWRRQLAGLVTLNLPTDRPRPAFQTFRGARQSVAIAPTLGAALNRVSRQHQATLFMTLLAAFMTLLQRYSGQDDIAVGSPIANRTRTELEGLIGFFVNTLVLRAELDSRLPFAELLARVRALTLAAYAHQDLPFEQLVEELQPVRDPSHNPLFQVMFVLQNQNAPMTATVLPDLRVQLITAHNQTAKVDLWLGVTEETQGLSGMLEYNTDLFDDATITRLGRQLQTLLENIVAAPEMRIGDLPLLTAHERSQLIAEWNDTLTACPTELCIQALFEAQAARTPDAVALVFERATKDERRRTNGADSSFSLQPSVTQRVPGLQLTYAELNARANQLAHHLRARGVGTETTVGICMERSPELIVGLLAILKAGGAYLPLDPASPPERLAFMLADAAVPVLIATKDDRPWTNDDLVPSQSPIVNRQSKIVNLPADWPLIARQAATPLASTVSAAHWGYVIYTSGSTGTPKGMAMSHRALVNLLHWQLGYLDHRVGTRFLQFASLSFDVSYQEIFPTLASGGVVVLIDETLRRDADALWQLLSREQVERIYLPYVGLQQLAEAATPHPLPRALRQVTVSGEQLQLTPAIRRMFRLLPGTLLHNFYGPSESHAISAHTLRGVPEYWPTLVPIGRPIANAQLYVLDAQLRPLPLGVVGELYIGGVGLVDGYLGRADLTAERFVPNPFGGDTETRRHGDKETRRQGDKEIVQAAEPQSAICNLQSAIGTRLYRSGDLARVLADGSLSFLGRRDGQVKVRGYRVELEEVAAVLAAHAAVQECVVLLRTDAPGAARLVAYVVPAADRTDTIYRVRTTDDQANPSIVLRPSSLANELRAFLQARLPEYMQPAAFVLLARLPLTINRKVDRKALPLPEPEQRMLERAVEPQTPLERELAAIWAEVLHIEQIGRHENFFALGGHSLLATQVVSRVRQHAGMDLPLRTLFEAPTVAGLAERIEALRLAAQHLHTSAGAAVGDDEEEGEL